MKIIHVWWFSFILLMGVAFSADVDILMRPSHAGIWQRNGVYTMDIVLKNNTSAPINLAGIELSFTYLSSLFKENAVIAVDNFSGNAANFVVNVLESKSNEINCQKGIKSSANPNYIAIAANGELIAYRVKLRVGSAAALGACSFNFKGGTALAKRISGGSTTAVSTEIANGSVTIAADSTPPVTWANPSGKTINLADYSSGILLNETADNEYDDLDKIFYTLDGNDPTLSSAYIVGKFSAIPSNNSSSKEGTSFILKYMGADLNGNLESIKQESYLVDVIAPEISAVSVNVNYAKKGTQILISFTVSERLSGSPAVKVGSNTASLLSSNDLTLEYTYSYLVLGTENQGTNTIEIRVVDINNNQTVNTAKSVIFDFLNPKYSINTLAPLAPKAEDTLTIVISANEVLNTSATKVSIDGNKANLNSASFPLYTYKYTVIGSEKTDLVFIEGMDLAGNTSTNTDGWGVITATGKDIYDNTGTSKSGVTINFIDRNKVKK